MEIEREKITRLLNERLESHDDSRKAAKDKLSEICYVIRKQIDDFEDSINSELENVFQDEDKRLQDALHNISESVSIEEFTKALQRAKAELLVTQSYELIQGRFIDDNIDNNDENDNNDDDLNEPETKRIKNISLLDFTKMYKLKMERKLNLKIIEFEERKPSNIIPEFTDDGELSISFIFFNDDENNVLKTLSPNFEVTIKMWRKDKIGKEYNAKIITKDFNVGEQQINFVGSFKPNTNYCVKFRIEHPKDGLFTQWSDEIEFITPEFKACIWKECPDCVDEENGYSVDEDNPRIATGFDDIFSTIIGNTPLPLNKVTSWSIKILKSGDNDGLGIYIGVAPFNIDQNEYENYNKCGSYFYCDDSTLFSGSTHNYNKCGWYFYCDDSTLFSGPPHNYDGKKYGPRKEWGEYVHTGDSVGVVMDTMKGEFSFVLNEINYGIAYEGIPLDKPLVPCVLIDLEYDDSVELDTTEVKETKLDTSISIPSNITTKSDTWDSITLTWDDVDGASFYQIEVDGSKIWDPSTVNGFTKRGFLPEAEHSFRIRTVKNGSVSEWSGIVKGKTSMKSFETSGWKECPEHADNEYSVDENNPKIATKNDSSDWCTIIGNTPLPFNKVTSWNIKILRSEDNDGNDTFIGVAPFDINQNDDNYEKCGWYFNCYYSILCSGPPHNYKYKEYGPRKEWGEYVHEGDSVGVVMDTTKGDLSFILNGVNCGVAYNGIPLDKPLVPCVILHCEGDSVELDISEVKETKLDTSVPIPSNVTTKSITWDSITLTWNDVEGASFYQIEVDGNKSWEITTTNTFTKRGFLPEAEHSFRIRTVKNGSVSEWSVIVQGKTLKMSFENSGWKKCPDDVEWKRKYFLDNNNPRVATMAGGYYTNIVGDASLPLNKVTSWNIKVLESKKNDGGGIYIGVAPFDINQNEKDNYIKCGWYFDCYTSTLCSGPPHKYDKKEYGPRKKVGKYIHIGDIVGVVMDTTKGELTFAVNNVNYGVAYEGIPLDKPLVPCVILWSYGDSVELDLSEVKESVDDSIPIPSNIITKSDTWNSITLTWNKIDGASFYQIEVDGSKFLDATTTNTFTKRNLLSETGHSFRVRAVKDDNKVSEWSDIVKGKTLKAPDFSECFWKKCPDYVDEKNRYSVDANKPKIGTKKVGYYYCTIICNTFVPLNKVTSWNIKILKSGKNDGYGIYIGVAPFDIDQDGRNNYEKCGWYFNCYNSTLRSGPPHEHRSKKYGPRKKFGEYVHTGNSVGVVIDTTKGDLSFVLNEVNLGVAFERIPLDKPLVPCVGLGREGDSVELDVSSEIKENVDSSIHIPSNITTKSVTWDSITLTWEVVESASFYQIEVDGNKSWGASTSNTFTKRGFLPETEHSFRVRTVKGNKVSEWSEVVKGKTTMKSFESSEWKECPDDADYKRKYFVNENNLKIATKIDSSDWCTIIGNTPLPLNKVTSWNIKILKSKSNDGDYINIGVAPFDINQNEDYNYNKCGWYFYCCTSMLFSGPPHDYFQKEYGPRKKGREYIHTGDTVGIVMDTTKGELSFVLNGVNLGVAYSGIPLDKPLVPCVILWYEGDAVEFINQ